MNVSRLNQVVRFLQTPGVMKTKSGHRWTQSMANPDLMVLPEWFATGKHNLGQFGYPSLGLTLSPLTIGVLVSGEGSPFRLTTDDLMGPVIPGGHKLINWTRYTQRVYDLDDNSPEYLMMDGPHWHDEEWDSMANQVARIRYAIENEGLFTVAEVMAIAAAPAKYQHELRLTPDDDI